MFTLRPSLCNSESDHINSWYNSWTIHDNLCSKTINSQLTNSQSQALAENNLTFNTQHSTLHFPIRMTACAERYCGGEPLIQLLLDDVVKERCREWIEEICNSQAKNN